MIRILDNVLVTNQWDNTVSCCGHSVIFLQRCRDLRAVPLGGMHSADGKLQYANVRLEFGVVRDYFHCKKRTHTNQSDSDCLAIPHVRITQDRSLRQHLHY